jgi:hypothetical protein
MRPTLIACVGGFDVESAVLGLLGGGLRLGLAYGALRILVAREPETLPRLGEIGIDPLVLPV